jgi:hypothetical protein
VSSFKYACYIGIKTVEKVCLSTVVFVTGARWAWGMSCASALQCDARATGHRILWLSSTCCAPTVWPTCCCRRLASRMVGSSCCYCPQEACNSGAGVPITFPECCFESTWRLEDAQKGAYNRIVKGGGGYDLGFGDAWMCGTTRMHNMDLAVWYELYIF